MGCAQRLSRPSAVVVAVLVCAAGLVGCSDASSESEPDRVTTEPASEEPSAAEPAPEGGPGLELTSGSGRTSLCDVERFGPVYNVFDVTLRALEDVEFVSARLEGERVRRLGPVLTVPPVNSGGEIALGGTSVGAPGEGVRRSRLVDWAGREDIEIHSYAAGDTALLVLRVRVDPSPGRPARLDRLALSYTSSGGEAQRTSVPLATTFRDQPC